MPALMTRETDASIDVSPSGPICRDIEICPQAVGISYKVLPRVF